MTTLAWILAAYFFFCAMVFGVRESRCRKMMRAMAERIDIQNQLLKPVTLSPKFGEVVHMVHAADTSPGCNCLRCRDVHDDAYERFIRGMVVCETCGNKRCPHASDHAYPCTGSNELNRPGSVYGGRNMPPADVSSC